jgi:hypothetical protein
MPSIDGRESDLNIIRDLEVVLLVSLSNLKKRVLCVCVCIYIYIYNVSLFYRSERDHPPLQALQL